MVQISVLLFCSGFAALTYEILWLRHLGLVFGNTVHAAATVMTAYMLGLALGAHLAGKWAERSLRPIRLFGMLEMGIGIYAALVPLLFIGVHYLHIFAYQHISESLPFLTFFRFVMAILLLLVPTCFMGATLPILSQGLLRQQEKFGGHLGLLYGANTLGAVAGTLSCGFLMIPGLGLTITNFLAIGVNATVGILAWHLSNSMDCPRQPDGTGTVEAPEHVWKPRTNVLLFAAGMSGLISLGFEVVWFRALVLVFGSTTYSFSAILSVFLVGIALGSMLLSWIADRLKTPVMLFCLVMIGVGVYSLVSLYWFTAMPELMLTYLMKTGLTWPNLLSAKFGITIIFLFLPTMFFGVAFAAADKAVREILPSASRTVGLVYTTNTLGSATGSVLAGFILLPMLGMETSLKVFSIAALLLGSGLAFVYSGTMARKIVFVLIPVCCLIAMIFYSPSWSEKALSEGPYFSPWKFITGDKQVIFSKKLKSKRLLFYKEGKTSTVSVSITPGERLHFSSNGKIEADSSPGGMMLQRMMGHLPMLFHPNPKRVVNIGLGAGVTFGALGCYPVDHLEVVEIEPEVRNVAKIWGPYNHHIVDDPRVTITINDGRNHLAVTPREYDVITSDPFEPVVAGAANLYTVEHFQTARERLAQGGIMCQFLPLYELSEENVLTIMRSFHHVFPDCLQFFTGYDTVLLGFKDGIQFDASVLKSKFEIPRVRESLKDLGIVKPETILSLFVADLSQSKLASQPGIMNTDNHPVIEFTAPRSSLHYTTDLNHELLKNSFTEIPGSLLTGYTEVEIQGIGRGREALLKSLEAYALRGRARNQTDMQESFDLLFEGISLAPENPLVRNELVEALILSANMLGTSNRTLSQAYRQYQMVLQYEPDNFWALFNLGDLALISGQMTHAKRWIRLGQTAYPDSPLILSLRGRYKGKNGDVLGGCEDLQAALKEFPEKWDLWEIYADLLKAKGDETGAIRAMARARALAQ
jgi:spermidine synthase